MLYQEATTVGVFNLVMMGVGIGLICGGCALVGKRKTMPKRYDRHTANPNPNPEPLTLTLTPNP